MADIIIYLYEKSFVGLSVLQIYFSSFAGITEWSKVADSRSVRVGVRGFDSPSPHFYNFFIENILSYL